MQFKHFALLSAAGLALAQNGTTPGLVDVLTNTPGLTNLTTFASSIPGLVDQLSAASNITILAPSDDAFSKLPEETVAALTADPGLLAAVLTYHVIQGTIFASQITETPAFAPTLLTNQTYTNVTGGQVVEAVTSGDQVLFFSGLLANSSVTTPNVNFTGGVIHVIDTVLTLPIAASDTALAAGLTSLYGALNATNLVETVDTTPDLTIFAPNNEAFQAIGSALPNLTVDDLTAILSYHVVAGTVAYSSTLQNGTVKSLNGADLTITVDDSGAVFVNQAEVLIPDVLIANGVVHVIDNVLNPNATSGPAPTATEGAPAYSGASSVSETPFASGVPAASTMINPPSTGTAPAGGASSSASSAPAGTGAAMPMKTGAVGAAALFGAGAAILAGY